MTGHSALEPVTVSERSLPTQVSWAQQPHHVTSQPDQEHVIGIESLS